MLNGYEVFNRFLPLACQMLIEHLRRIPPLCTFKTPAEIRAFLADPPNADMTIRVLQGQTVAIPGDLFHVGRALGLKFGLTIQYPSGETLTFFPELPGYDQAPAAITKEKNSYEIQD